MAAKEIKLEGIADISANDLLCVCGKCNNHDREKATVEFNFREKKIFYLCSQCGFMNEVCFGPPSVQRLPRTRLG